MIDIIEQLEACKEENHRLRNQLQEAINKLELARTLLEDSAEPFDKACVAVRESIESLLK